MASFGAVLSSRGVPPVYDFVLPANSALSCMTVFLDLWKVNHAQKEPQERIRLIHRQCGRAIFDRVVGGVEKKL